MPIFWFVLTFAAVQGLLSGSFLNVCIQRLPLGRSVVKPRSACMACSHPVRWYDNIPLVSFLVLRGRCRDCSAAISASYPLVEFALGAWFVFCAIPFAMALASGTDSLALMLFALQTLELAVFGFLLTGLMVMDWKWEFLPNEFTLLGLFAGLFFAAAESFWVPSVRYKTFFTPEEVFFGKRLAAAAAGYVLLTGIAFLYRVLRKRKGMGGGDARQLAMIGAFLGLEKLGLAFFVALFTCTVFSITLLVSRRANGRTAVPFGSFLSIGGLTAAAFGDRIVPWYLGLFR